MTGHKLSAEGKVRMETMVATNDGFEIAEVDLKLRGPGDFQGTQQSGVPMGLKLANLATDGQLVQLARDVAGQLLKADPGLEREENHPIRAYHRQLMHATSDWGRIL